ncbi:MAG: GNAT family N-acetyltransferase [Aureispira sp.]
MVYLQRAKLEHAQLWFSILEDNRAHLEPWLPNLKEIVDVTTAQAYVKKYALLDIYLGIHIYEMWTEEGQIIGLATVHSGRFKDKSAELAYWLGTAYTGKGYATTACRHLISMAFASHRLTGIKIRCLVDNIPSQQVAKRLGMQPLPREANQLLFEIQKEDWEQDADYWLWFLED